MAKFSEKVRKIFGRGPEGEIERPTEPIERKSKIIQKGDTIRIQRSDVRIETDWIVHEIINPDAPDPKVIVRGSEKDLDGKYSFKEIPLSELKKINDF